MTASRATEYDFQVLAEGVTVARARRSGTALSNSGIVDLGSSTLVFDTGLTLRAARELRSEAERATGRAPSLVANSHWHLDHLLGNQEFVGQRLASRGTIEYLERHRAELAQELTAERLAADLREASLSPPGAGSPTELDREELEVSIRITRQLLAEAADLTITVPDTPFDSSLTLRGDREARLVTFGAAHTESDGLLFLPEHRILFAADVVVVGHHPNLLSGDPQHWLEVLEEIERVKPESVVPGHGPVSSAEVVGDVRDYLETVMRLAETPGPTDLPERFRSWMDPGQFERNLGFLRRRSHPEPPKPPDGSG